METFTLLLILIILILTLIGAIALFIKKLLYFVNNTCGTVRWFISQNAGFFKIIFIMLFLLEQMAFVLILNTYFEIPKWASVFIGLFSLIVISTSSLQVFIWEYKYRTSQQQLNLIKHINLITEKYENIVDRFTKLKEK